MEYLHLFISKRKLLTICWALTPKSNIIKMSWRFDGLDVATNIIVFHFLPQVGNRGMSRVVCTKNLYRLLHFVGLVDILN